jgi:hypothetical protein
MLFANGQLLERELFISLLLRYPVDGDLLALLVVGLGFAYVAVAYGEPGCSYFPVHDTGEDNGGLDAGSRRIEAVADGQDVEALKRRELALCHSKLWIARRLTVTGLWAIVRLAVLSRVHIHDRRWVALL